MSWLSRIVSRGVEARAASLHSPEIVNLIQGGELSAERASRHAVALRCIQAKAEALASVPLNLYRTTDKGGRERVTTGPLAELLNDQFSERQTAFEAREALSAWCDVHGNSFARVEIGGRGEVVAVHPMAPGSVSAERLTGGRLRFRHTDPDGRLMVLTEDEVLHLRHRSRDGVLGVSPIQWAAETAALAVEQTTQAKALVQNGMQPSGIISLAGAANSAQMQAMVERIRDGFTGAKKVGRVLVLDGGAEFKRMALTSADAEFLESRKLSNLDVARIFGVPPTVAGITDNATYSNVTQENRAFVARCLAPWARRIEQAMNRALLTPEERRSMFIEHDLSGLLRGDLEARFEAYRVGREGGWLSANDIRAMENLSPIEGGDAYLRPLNMADASKEDQK
ncbi:phage portal protein [Rhodovulum sp. DZ06]|uniref:phage portal protein n=1 Tax=Rhodovulum sp. DZ06 TaxID=3425126 RepID=UPI003D33DE03